MGELISPCPYTESPGKWKNKEKKRYLFFLCLEMQYQKLEFLVHCVNHTTGGFCTRLAL
jgi:hypothetical protein